MSWTTPSGGTYSLTARATTASGVVGGETLAAVTLSAGGIAVDDAPGTYPITPANATGGTADLNNHDFNYHPGTLTATVTHSPLETRKLMRLKVSQR